MSALITEDALKTWLGFKKRSTIEQWLRDNGVQFRHSKGNQLVTTQAAIDRAFIGSANDAPMDTDDFFT